MKLKYEIDSGIIDTGFKFSGDTEFTLSDNMIKDPQTLGGPDELKIEISNRQKTYNTIPQREKLGEGSYGIIYPCKVLLDGSQKVVKLVVYRNTNVVESADDRYSEFLSEIFIPKIISLLIAPFCNKLSSYHVCVTSGYKQIKDATGNLIDDSTDPLKIGAVLIDKYDSDADKYFSDLFRIGNAFTNEQFSYSLGQFLYSSLITFEYLDIIGFVQCDYKFGNCLVNNLSTPPFVRFYMSDFGSVTKKQEYDTTVVNASRYRDLIKKILSIVPFTNRPAVSTRIFTIPAFTGHSFSASDNYVNLMKNQSWEIGICCAAVFYSFYFGVPTGRSISRIIMDHLNTKDKLYDLVVMLFNDLQNTPSASSLPRRLPTTIKYPAKRQNNSFINIRTEAIVYFVFMHLLGFNPTTLNFDYRLIVESGSAKNAFNTLTTVNQTITSGVGTIPTPFPSVVRTRASP